MLSLIQQELFLKASSRSHDGVSTQGEFTTSNNWIFSFVIDDNLICELYHRMTNNRVFGWDAEGNELDYKTISQYFELDEI